MPSHYDDKKKKNRVRVKPGQTSFSDKDIIRQSNAVPPNRGQQGPPRPSSNYNNQNVYNIPQADIEFQKTNSMPTEIPDTLRRNRPGPQINAEGPPKPTVTTPLATPEIQNPAQAQQDLIAEYEELGKVFRDPNRTTNQVQNAVARRAAISSKLIQRDAQGKVVNNNILRGGDVNLKLRPITKSEVAKAEAELKGLKKGSKEYIAKWNEINELRAGRNLPIQRDDNLTKAPQRFMFDAFPGAPTMEEQVAALSDEAKMNLYNDPRYRGIIEDQISNVDKLRYHPVSQAIRGGLRNAGDVAKNLPGFFHEMIMDPEAYTGPIKKEFETLTGPGGPLNFTGQVDRANMPPAFQALRRGGEQLADAGVRAFDENVGPHLLDINERIENYAGGGKFETDEQKTERGQRKAIAEGAGVGVLKPEYLIGGEKFYERSDLPSGTKIPEGETVASPPKERKIFQNEDGSFSDVPASDKSVEYRTSSNFAVTPTEKMSFSGTSPTAGNVTYRNADGSFSDQPTGPDSVIYGRAAAQPNNERARQNLLRGGAAPGFPQITNTTNVGPSRPLTVSPRRRATSPRATNDITQRFGYANLGNLGGGRPVPYNRRSSESALRNITTRAEDAYEQAIAQGLSGKVARDRANIILAEGRNMVDLTSSAAYDRRTDANLISQQMQAASGLAKEQLDHRMNMITQAASYVDKDTGKVITDPNTFVAQAALMGFDDILQRPDFEQILPRVVALAQIGRNYTRLTGKAFTSETLLGEGQEWGDVEWGDVLSSGSVGFKHKFLEMIDWLPGVDDQKVVYLPGAGAVPLNELLEGVDESWGEAAKRRRKTQRKSSFFR